MSVRKTTAGGMNGMLIHIIERIEFFTLCDIKICLPIHRLNFIYTLQDRPLHEDHLDLWMLLIAIGIGLLLLLVVVLICWRCGFFKRRRPADMLLHKAHYQFHALDQFSESS